MQSIINQNAPLTMVRNTLDDIPEFPLPARFSLRWFVPGDEQAWVDINTSADRYNDISPDLFYQEFGCAQKQLPQRMCFLCAQDGTAIGTAAAWFADDPDWASWGRIHWLALDPAFQGKGLSKPLMTAVCTRLSELGHTQAYLKTSSARIPAINLYLLFGFTPYFATKEDYHHWKVLFPGLKYTIY
jgi:GNAT superfamily N-acetyltransferase